MGIMRKYSKRIVWFSLFMTASFIIGCGGSDSTAVPVTPASAVVPTVISTTPDVNLTGVAINRKIVANFSTAMSSATINTTTYTLTDANNSSVAGTVSYSGTTAVFTPSTNLSINTQYTATITTGAKSTTNTALAANYVWSFTTGATADTTNPDVNSTDPTAGSTNIPINRAITAIFSESMDPLSISATTFHVSDANGSIAGTVSYVGTTATFTPTNNLALTTLYTATITTGVQDLAGNPMLANKVWTFTTAAAAAAGPNPVALGLAGNYAIFANTGIDNAVSPAVIIGDMGVGPGVTSTAITGFFLNLAASSPYSTSPQVTGKIYAFDYAAPTPANVTTASTDMGLAYNDAAGRLLPDVLNLAGGNLGGLTLLPGLYRWDSAVTLPVGTNVTLNGGPNDVWIFQITGTLTTAASTNVLLTGGALAKNIFWQVAGSSVTLGANAHFEGVVLAKAAINFGNKTSANCRLLAQTAVNLSENNITQPTP